MCSITGAVAGRSDRCRLHVEVCVDTLVQSSELTGVSLSFLGGVGLMVRATEIEPAKSHELSLARTVPSSNQYENRQTHPENDMKVKKREIR